MRITFVTASHTTYDETKSVDVARQCDLDQTNEQTKKLDAQLASVSKKLATLEKSIKQLEKSLANVDTRLRDDCKSIFADLIKESLAPVFSVMKQAMGNSGAEVLGAKEEPTPKRKVSRTAGKKSPAKPKKVATTRKTEK